MALKDKRTKAFLILILIATLVSLGCGLTERLGSRLAGDPVPTASLPVRTPWPTFTPTQESAAIVPPEEGSDQEPAVVKLSDLPTSTRQPTDTSPPPPPTNTPPPQPPVNTVPPPPTNTPAPPPPPTATPVPPPPPKPQYQFSPAPWYAGDRNDAIVRFYGYLKDTNDSPVNGYPVRASCGDFSVLSFPSGPSPVAPDWAPGFYDIVANPVSCNWTLQVVEYQCNTPGFFDAQCKEFDTLSEAIPVMTDVAAGETIIVASWIKNW